MYDLIFVGGGLASSLTAWRLTECHPGLSFRVIEAESTLGGNHTWSFFESDLSAEELAWIRPLTAHRWQGYDVRFPSFHRTLTTGYCSTDSARLHELASQVLGEKVMLGAPVKRLDATEVEMATGETMRARLVVDARGPSASSHLMLGFQKFTGRVVDLASPHGLVRPVIMDATVPQDGDFRFMYTLPIGERRLLIEDTRYSDSPAIERDRDTRAISDYAERCGWSIADVVREEHGALPITLGGDIDGYWADSAGAARLGLKAALFHATTGYSFADAVRTAHAVAALDFSQPKRLYAFLRNRSQAHWRAQGYWRFLNRMLFRAAEPDSRWKVMERFYRLRQPLIERFYAGRSTFSDKLRILSGRPPVPVHRAIGCIREASLGKSS
jgi:lycopene beta-cyclase